MKYYLLASVTLLFLASCGSEEETPPGTYAQGLLVINEGNFGAGNGSLSFINSEGEVIQNAFALANNGLQPGDIVQSVHETEDLILLVVNNSNILYALDKGELSITYQIEGLSLPRYATSAGSIGYVSEWVSFSDPGRITSFDLATGEMIDRINVGLGADELLISENQLYVSNSFESSISVIDLTNFAEVSTINTSPSPGKISEAADGALWVLCGGGFDADFNNANDGALQKISNTTIIETLTLGQNISANFTLNAAKNRLYAFSGTSVYEVDLTSPSWGQPLFTDPAASSYYGIGMTDDQTLLLTDSKFFQSNGEVITYELSGDRKTTYTVGVGPNGMLFR